MKSNSKFLQNLKAIFDNSPLILSASLEPEEVSLNRVIIFLGFWMLPISIILLVYFVPDKLTICLPYWQSGLAAWTTLATANVAKKVFTPKGGE